MRKAHALVLAAGKGRRMQSDTHKQFLTYRGEALFLCSVRVFLSCGIPVTVVTGEEDIPEIWRLLSEADLSKEAEGLPLPDVTAGGDVRYLSAYKGLQHLKALGGAECVLIHDAARPFVTGEIVNAALESALKYGAAAAAVMSKDTVKIADSEGFVTDTPDRSRVYLIQTPQVFDFHKIIDAYEKMLGSEEDLAGITDDASVMERYGSCRVYLSPGSYGNVKITTPEDLEYLKEH